MNRPKLIGPLMSAARPKFGGPLTPCTCGRGNIDVDPECPLHYPKPTRTIDNNRRESRPEESPTNPGKVDE